MLCRSVTPLQLETGAAACFPKRLFPVSLPLTVLECPLFLLSTRKRKRLEKEVSNEAVWQLQAVWTGSRALPLGAH